MFSGFYIFMMSSWTMTLAGIYIIIYYLSFFRFKVVGGTLVVWSIIWNGF